MTNCSLQCRFIKKKSHFSRYTLRACRVSYSLVDCTKTIIQHVVRMKTHRSLAKYFRNYLYLLSTSSEDK